MNTSKPMNQCCEKKATNSFYVTTTKTCQHLQTILKQNTLT